MTRRSSRLPAVLLAAGLPLAGCAAAVATRPATRAPAPSAGPTAGPTAGTVPPGGGPAAELYRRLRGGLQDGLGRTLPGTAGAPRRAYPVGRRVLALARGVHRPLPTILWYPAAGPGPDRPDRNAAGRDPLTGAPDPAAAEPVRAAVARPPVPVADGRFPLVLLSHGLHGRPEQFAGLAARWAAAGFVVAAPAYPYTHRQAANYRRADIVHQPADAAYVIAELSRLDTAPGGPLAGHLDTARVGAAGHSAGGYTTAGLFTDGHHPALRAGVVIAGWAGPEPFGGPPARLLFVHGSADAVVLPAAGWAAYHRLPWPGAMLTLPGLRHGGFLRPGRPGFATVATATTDFLRWTLYDDATARDRLSGQVTLSDPGGARTPGRW